MIRVLLADDEELIRAALAALLALGRALCRPGPGGRRAHRARVPADPRELEVLRLAEFDTPVAVIARRTRLSAGTVRNYLAAAVQKIGVQTRAEAVRTARENGWL